MSTPLLWVEPHEALPIPGDAAPHGLIAAGRDLGPERLMEAYGKGLFPWYGPGDPVLWWSPDPRMVLSCDALRVSRSLAKRVRQFDRDPALRITLNQAFSHVVAHCAQRPGSRLTLGEARAGTPWPTAVLAQGRDGTWITPEITTAYITWAARGHVHSVETWINGRLAGGLYGVSIGGCFFGESMFSLVSDASKVALVYLVRYLQRHHVPWVDCQQETPHLARLGARPQSRARFLNALAQQLKAPMPPWGRGQLHADGTLTARTPPAPWPRPTGFPADPMSQ